MMGRGEGGIYMCMWQLQIENEHYSVYNYWLNLITCSSSIAIVQHFSTKVGTVIVDRWGSKCL